MTSFSIKQRQASSLKSRIEEESQCVYKPDRDKKRQLERLLSQSGCRLLDMNDHAANESIQHEAESSEMGILDFLRNELATATPATTGTGNQPELRGFSLEPSVDAIREVQLEENLFDIEKISAAAAVVAAAALKIKKKKKRGRPPKDHPDADSSQKKMCPTCGVLVSSYGDHFKRHVMTHDTERKRYTCVVCSKTFSRSDHLSRHRRKHTHSIQYYCRYCNRAFTRPDKLRIHEKTHKKQAIENSFCEIRGEVFNSEELLATHKQELHANNVGENSEECMYRDKMRQFERLLSHSGCRFLEMNDHAVNEVIDDVVHGYVEIDPEKLIKMTAKQAAAQKKSPMENQPPEDVWNSIQTQQQQQMQQKGAVQFQQQGATGVSTSGTVFSDAETVSSVSSAAVQVDASRAQAMMHHQRVSTAAPLSQAQTLSQAPIPSASAAYEQLLLQRRPEDSDGEIFPQVCPRTGAVQELPSEIWTRIFQWTVDEEGPLPFLLKMATVCSIFRRAAKAPKLWKRVNFNTGKIKQSNQLEVVAHVTKHFMRPNFTKHLNLGQQIKLENEQFKEILEKTPNLESLNLSFCRNLDAKSVLNQILGDSLPNLKNLDLTSFVSSSFGKTGVGEFLEKRSKGLEYLYLNKNYISGMSGILRNAKFWACAPTLVSLDLSGIATGKTDWELNLCIREFAKATPNLQYYRAIDFQVSFKLDNEEKDHGLWQHLKEVNVSLADGKVYLSNLHTGLLKFLGGCRSLRRLEFSKVPVNLNSVAHLEDCSLTHLLMSKCISSMVENAALYRFSLAFRQFGPGLLELDISWCTDADFIKLIFDVFTKHTRVHDTAPRLEKFNLQGCPVDQKDLREMLRACERLSWLDISSCRSLPSGVKRVYRSRSDIENLIMKL